MMSFLMCLCIISTSVCPTGYVPVTNPTVPITTSDNITVSWPSSPGATFVENYILEYTLGQIGGRRRRRQAESFNVTVPGSQTSYTLRDNVQPFTRYTFRVFTNFGNGVVSLTVASFTTQTEEARTLLQVHSLLYIHNIVLVRMQQFFYQPFSEGDLLSCASKYPYISCDRYA